VARLLKKMGSFEKFERVKAGASIEEVLAEAAAAETPASESEALLPTEAEIAAGEAADTVDEIDETNDISEEAADIADEVDEANEVSEEAADTADEIDETNEVSDESGGEGEDGAA
jgi:hypothetical protein